MGAVYPLSETASVVLNSSGNGTVNMGPTRLGQTWRPTIVAVSTSTATKVPIADVKQGNTDLGSTFSGSNDSNALTGITVYPGQHLTITWTGGDVGAVATASVSGEIEQW
jgi:hypothetical protein